jgi:hypothetical protein
VNLDVIAGTTQNDLHMENAGGDNGNSKEERYIDLMLLKLVFLRQANLSTTPCYLKKSATQRQY